MGMLACYMEADTKLLDSLKTLDADDLFEEIERLEEESKLEVYNLEKLWDGLHFLLTGKSASYPILSNLKSEAIDGTHKFINDNDADYIAYIEPERLAEIITSLECVDIDELLKKFSPNKFHKKQIYPDIWYEADKESLIEELKTSFLELTQFYKKLSDKHTGVIVSIY